MKDDAQSDRNVARFLGAMAQEFPDRTALIAPLPRGETLRTFAELERETAALARLLLDAGVEPGQRVLLMVRPGLDLIRIVFALFRVGAPPVVIDPGMGLKKFCACVRHTRPDALVGVPLAVAVSRVFGESFRSVRTRITVGTRRFERALSQAASTPAIPWPMQQADSVAGIFFTSGSTGPAKGVLYTHGIFDAQVRLIQATYGMTPGEVDLPMLPVFALFNPALGMATVVPEMNPARPATVNPEHIVKAIQRYQVTNSFGSPVLWRKIGDWCVREGVQLPSLRRILVAGASVPPELMRQAREHWLPHGEMHSPYGATEALPLTSITSATVLGETWSRTQCGQGTCVGTPLSGITIRIIAPEEGPLASPEALRDLPQGTIGEIVATGPVITPGYVDNPQATAAAKVPVPNAPPWHRMGDMGYLDSQGRLWFCGRKAERVLTPEGPLDTDCCEAIYNAHPDVARTALVGLGPAGQQTPALWIEPHPRSWPRTARERQALAQSLHALGQAHAHTRGLHTYFYHRRFPVDVRHNAKIHRLTLREAAVRHPHRAIVLPP